MVDFSVYPDDAYGDVVRDVVDEWSRAAARARARGVREDALVFDPGLGFAKNVRQSAELLARTAEIVKRAEPHPVLIGASRKSFLTLADPKARPQERLGASIGAALFAVRAGARAVRVHDVRATRQALDLEIAMRALASSQHDERHAVKEARLTS
jgi:dihydropteroate synthase